MKVLVLGNSQTSEMRPIVACIRRHAAAGAVECVQRIDHAVGLANHRHWFPDLGVVCQHFPDEFSRANVERLLSLLPVTRWVCCFGAWCESDGRNRDMWPLAVRISARCAGSRIRRELDVLAGEQAALPLTAARDEIFEFDCPGGEKGDRSNLCVAPCGPSRQIGPVPFFNPPRSIAVMTADSELRRWVGDLLRAAGHRILTATDDDVTPDAVVWDVDPWSDLVAGQLREFSAQNPKGTIVALAAFAHPEDVESLKACGVDTVLTKLTTHNDLLESLRSA